MLRVKVCGMRQPLNVKEIAGANPDYMGFIFYPGSKRYVGDEPRKELFMNIPHEIKKTGVFYNQDKQKILSVATKFGLDAVQMHGAESTDLCAEVRASGLMVIKTFHIGPGFSFTSLVPYVAVCDFFLFDTKGELAGGSGKKFGWEVLDDYTIDKPYFLSGGIDPEDGRLIRSLGNNGFYGVDINSRFEISPGLKDPLKVKEFITEIKEDSYEI